MLILPHIQKYKLPEDKEFSSCTTRVNAVPTMYIPHFGRQQLRDIKRPKNVLRTTSDVKEANRALAPKEFSGKVGIAATVLLTEEPLNRICQPLIPLGFHVRLVANTIRERGK